MMSVTVEGLELGVGGGKIAEASAREFTEAPDPGRLFSLKLKHDP